MKRRHFVILFCFVFGCGNGNEENGGSDGGDAGEGDGGGCTTTVGCMGGKICDPATRTCVVELKCESHGACGKGAYCGDDGKCAPSKSGNPCASDDNCIPGETCDGTFCSCGGEKYTAEGIPPNMLIVLDRSDSMNESIQGGTKWTVAKQAISDLLTSHGDNIRFGLALFPGLDQSCEAGQMCSTGAVFVDPGDSTATEIVTFLGGAGTCRFGTPTAEMLTSLVDYAGLADEDRPNYILLVTDGQSTCLDPIPVVKSLRAETPEVKTFVIGFGEGVDPDELNTMAEEGGTAISGGPPSYYVAGDAASLASAFATIAVSVMSCSYTLSEEPPDVDDLYVYQDEEQIARDTDHSAGWDYDPVTRQLTFYGPACDALRSGQVKDLAIVYGCPLKIG